MKHQIITKTADFCNVTSDFEGTAEEAIRESKRLISLEKTAEGGVPVKEFEEILELMIAREPIEGDPGIVEGFNSAQKWAFDLVRRAVNRIDYKNK